MESYLTSTFETQCPSGISGQRTETMELSSPMLAIFLSRYNPTGTGALATVVTVPLVLNVGSRTYNLVGTTHYLSGIHYIAEVRHQGTGEWLRISDQSVTPISSPTLTSSNLYHLIYELDTGKLTHSPVAASQNVVSEPIKPAKLTNPSGFSWLFEKASNFRRFIIESLAKIHRKLW